MPNEATDRQMFELRCRTPEDTTLRVGPIWSRDEADAIAAQRLAEGRAVRCDLYRNIRGDLRLIGRIGQPKPPPPALPGEPDEW